MPLGFTLLIVIVIAPVIYREVTAVGQVGMPLSLDVYK